MAVAGVFLTMILFFGGIAITQAIFFQQTGRLIWRAVVPTALRFTLMPEDKVKMDSFMVMEELAALMFLGAFLMLPMIALSVMGFINVF
ncbi:MAG: hypothetical protein Kow0029_15160 [Candidatus Rifleibacteriota bacterium]